MDVPPSSPQDFRCPDIGHRPCWVCSLLDLYTSDNLLAIMAKSVFDGTRAPVCCWLDTESLHQLSRW